MADPAMFMVGVPGMGNADPSWHQRRPYGFFRCGYRKVQARSHAHRRPSTASGRLTAAPMVGYHRPSLPRALAVDKSKYSGTHGSMVDNVYDYGNNSRAGSTTRGIKRPDGARSRRVRERPMSAGCYRPASPLVRTSVGFSSAAVETCTRNPAGIVRGGGRDGRAAPPATPPRSPRCSSLDTEAAATSQQHQHNQPPIAAATLSRRSSPRTPPPHHAVNHRRPSTAGVKRSRAGVGVGDGCYHHGYENAFTTSVQAGDSRGIAPTGNNDVGFNPSESPVTGKQHGPCDDEVSHGGVPYYARNGVADHEDHGSLYSSRKEYRGVGYQEEHAGMALAATPTPEAADTTAAAQHRDTRRTIRRNAQDATSRRRRPASANSARSRTTNDHQGYPDGYSDGGSSGAGYSKWGGDTTRGRRNVRSWDRKTQRPRSASATTRGRAHTYDASGTGLPTQHPLGSCRPMSATGMRSPPADGGRRGLREYARPQSAATATPPAVVPSFVVSEKQVLRFFGHLTEELDWGCPRSPGEEIAGGAASPILKIRQVVLHLYLADGSLEIFEKRQANSGQQGGLLLKRNIFKKRDGSMYGVGDLKVGSDLKLLGRSYRLTGCDEYTRKWYECEGFRQPEAQPVPKEINQCLRVEHTTGLCNKPQRPHTATSGRPPSASGRSSQESSGLRRAHQEKVRRFFRHDKETLRFQVVWDDPSVGGTRKRYDLLLFLEDETVSLLNPREERQNSGSDESMIHVRRQRLPKDWTTRTDVNSGGEGGEADDGSGGGAFVGELDLAVGRSVYVWGREMKLVGCDPFTKAYYRRMHGIDMEANLNKTAAAAERPAYGTRRTKAAVVGKQRPPGGGTAAAAAAGTGTDYLTSSLGRYKGGAPGGALPVDRYRGHRLRCKAVLRSSMPNDKGREFVITYDLAWDTLMVYELQRRNSGRPGGLFLVKGRHRRPGGSNRYYVPQDLYLGAVVPLVTGHTLVVTEMDRSSLALCEAHPREFPLMDCRRVLGRIAQRARNMRLALRSELHRRAAKTPGNTATAAREIPGDEGGRNGGSISPSRVGAAAAAAAAASNMSRWTAGKILTKGDGNRNGDSDNDRHWVPSGAAPATSTAETPRQARGTLGMNGRNDSDTSHHGSRGGVGNGRDVPSGRRARSGATWGLVGGWGDSYANATETGENNNSTNNNNSGTGDEPRGVVQPNVSFGYTHHENRGGNPKNESATAPWAAVQAAGVNVFKLSTGQAAVMAKKSAGTPRRADAGTDLGAKKRSADGNGCDTFEGHEAFRDAMDGLGLLVGLGQQEVLTLVRAFTDKRGKRILWASMCDSISQLDADAVATATAPAATPEGGVRGTRDTMGGVRIPAATRKHRRSLEPPAAGGETLMARMREAGVPWRAVFVRVREESGKESSCGVLGVASLVQAMRRNGLSIGAGDAAFLAKHFARGGGSQVPFHTFCDAIYPCDFSPPAPSRSPPISSEGDDSGVARPCSIGNGCGVSVDRGGCAEDHSMGGTRGGRAPGHDFDLGGGSGSGGVGSGTGTIDYGDGRLWSLWDRRAHARHPVQHSFGLEGGDEPLSCGKGEGGSSRCWDEEEAVF